MGRWLTKKWLKVTLIVVAAVLVVVVVVVVAVFFMMRSQGIGLVRHPIAEREPLEETLEETLDEHNVSYEGVAVTTEDGLKLVGWYVPSRHRAAIIAQHGYKGDRGDLTGLPAFPFAPMIIFWAEREADIDTSQMNTTEWIKEISPRPVFILQGGQDDHISIDSGQKLYDAAGEPKELWYEPGAAHHGLEEQPFEAEFERRVVAFFDKYLLGK
jgi:pimeloyl-ACP methyl ester carboxylesterase